MSVAALNATGRRWLRSLAPIGRALVGVALGGALGAAAFLIVAEQGRARGDTSLRFSHALGILAGGRSQEVKSQGALGVVGDTAGPRGLYAALLAAVALVALYGILLEPRLRARRWPAGGVALGLLTFLVVGLVFGPLVGARVPASEAVAGLFGADAGTATPLWLGLASLAFGALSARVYGLVRSADWWEERHEGLEEQLGGLVGAPPIEPDRTSAGPPRSPGPAQTPLDPDGRGTVLLERRRGRTP